MSKQRLSDEDNKLVARVGMESRDKATSLVNPSLKAYEIVSVVFETIRVDLAQINHLGPDIARAVLKNSLAGYMKRLQSELEAQVDAIYGKEVA